MGSQLAPTWGKNWTGPYEGPFTLALKSAWANLPTAAGTSSLFDGQQFGWGWQEQGSASLLSRPPQRHESWTAHCLGRYAGEWTFELASDKFFRFCPDCLRHGYQAAAYQIQALLMCPVHLCELRTTCMNCESPTCSYSLNSVAFNNPFHCWRCGKFWVEGLNLRSLSDTDALHAACHARLGRIYCWLSSLQDFSIIDRRKGARSAGEGLGWYRTVDPDCQLLQRMGVDKKIAGFWIAAQLSPMTADQHLFFQMDRRFVFSGIAVCTNSKHEPDEHYEHLATFISIYKSIRRQIERRYLKQSGRGIAVDMPSSGHSRMPRKVRHLLTPCFAIWRRRFELTQDVDLYKRVQRSWSAYSRTDSSIPSAARRCRFFYSSAFLNWYRSEKDPRWPVELLPFLVLANFFSLCHEVTAILDEVIKDHMAQNKYSALDTYAPTDAIWQHANLRQRILDRTDFPEQVSGPYFGRSGTALASASSQAVLALTHSSLAAKNLARIWD